MDQTATPTDQTSQTDHRDLAAVIETLSALVIEHRHGSDITLHPSADAARRHLLNYVTEWWAEECPDEDQPADADEAIATYFDNAHDEFYTLTAAIYCP